MVDTPHKDFLDKYGRYIKFVESHESFAIVIPGVTSALKVGPYKLPFGENKNLLNYIKEMVRSVFQFSDDGAYVQKLGSNVEIKCTGHLFGASLAGPDEDLININIILSKSQDGQAKGARLAFELLEQIMKVSTLLNSALGVEAYSKFGFSGRDSESSGYFEIPDTLPELLLNIPDPEVKMLR